MLPLFYAICHAACRAMPRHADDITPPLMPLLPLRCHYAYFRFFAAFAAADIYGRYVSAMPITLLLMPP